MNAINIASRAVSSKSSLPALEGLLISAGRELTITGYNLRTGIKTSFPADIPETGDIILNSSLFSGIVKKLPDDAVTVTCDDNFMTTIKCGRSEFNIMGIDPADFPEMPEVGDGTELRVPQDKLRAMINGTLFAASDNESQRPVLTGALFELENERLTVVALDGYRLAVRRDALESSEVRAMSFIVPGAALGEVEKIAGDVSDLVTISVGNKHILFEFEDTTLVSRRIEGEFLDYKKVVPETSDFSFTADRRELIDCVERVSLIINDRLKSPLRLLFDEGSVQLSATTALGRSQDYCSVQGDGKGLEAGFNNRYLLEALKAAPSEEIVIEISTPVSPCVFRSAKREDDSFLYMVLPVRIRSGD